MRRNFNIAADGADAEWSPYTATEIAERGAWAVCAEYAGHIERLLDALAQERKASHTLAMAVSTRDTRIAELEVELRRAQGCGYGARK